MCAPVQMWGLIHNFFVSQGGDVIAFPHLYKSLPRLCTALSLVEVIVQIALVGGQRRGQAVDRDIT